MYYSTLGSKIFWIFIISIFLASCASSAPTSLPTLTPAPTKNIRLPVATRVSLEASGACSPGDTSTMGVLRSTDHGATWTSLGRACIEKINFAPADPTGFADNGRIVLYLVDFGKLQQKVPQIIYRTSTVDGVNFDTPQPAYMQDDVMVDPDVLQMGNGTYRMYVPSGTQGIISAVSRYGSVFNQEPGIRLTNGGMPGALLLPDKRIRLFLNGGLNGQTGIFSMISQDGLNFTQEDGMRIAASPGQAVDDAQPIALKEGGYLMLYQIHPASMTDQPKPWTFTEIHLATSGDGLNWSGSPTIIGYGGTSCLIETVDETLYIYYGTGNP